MTNDYSSGQSVSNENEERVVGHNICFECRANRPVDSLDVRYEKKGKRGIRDESEDFIQFKSHSSWLSSKPPPLGSLLRHTLPYHH